MYYFKTTNKDNMQYYKKQTKKPTLSLLYSIKIHISKFGFATHTMHLFIIALGTQRNKK